MLFRRI